MWLRRYTGTLLPKQIAGSSTVVLNWELLHAMLGDDGDVSSELPTWELVLAAARHLSVTQGEFRLSQLISEVQLIDPARDRGTIQPVVQGMTANAGKGPPSPCGKPLTRVDHGVYRMSGATGGTLTTSG